ncbi:amidohydrolase family protein [Weissella sagaensis]|uniref:Amidohydrolase family protein n=1 Tax=Weissella sagaensis TaxID=2559928 RepID=A0ABW1RV91_9LACO|nr:amidohydrolase family protein [Weissella sagaensis]QDJ59623.1 amidohydrolase family protein [Weissella hellenica]QEA56936.1 amidohydrolase family protein [Weissella hellenica]UEG67751.1 amidohydrolase family protein [Weissella hellenica]
MKVLYKNANVFTGNNTDFEEGINFIVDTDSGEFITATDVDQEVDLVGKYVMPGMINAHTHIVADPYEKISTLGDKDVTAATSTFLALKNLNALLTDGVTYIRDVGSVFDVDIELSALEECGELVAPGIIASGYPLTMTGGHFSNGSYEVDGVDEVKKFARLVMKKGARNVKMMATGGVSFNGETPWDVQMTEEELRAGVIEAHHKGRTACAHAQGTEGIQNALRAGVDSVEHAIFLDDETIQMFLDKDIYIVPTLTAPWAINQNADELPDFMVKKSLAVEKAHRQSIGQAAKAGVKLAMGTDSGTAYNNFNKNSSIELAMMVDTGATNLQALQAATINGADLLKITDHAGSIEAGKLADFIVLDDNPMQDIKALQADKVVYKKGHVVA